MNERIPVLQAIELNKIFGFGKNATHAVCDSNLSFYQSEVASIVGESGSGKTTLARMLLGLLKPSSGSILYCGSALDVSNHVQRNKYWHEVQAIFQDPFSSFNIFYKVEKLLLECLHFAHGKMETAAEKKMISDALSFVNMKLEEVSGKYPFELSGGQMQRLMIARIFIMQPEVLIADEPTSMIDACSRATILEMLLKLNKERGMTIIFITHDMGLAYHVSDTIYIMEHGKLVESGAAEEVISNPRHPYTIQLLADVPKLHQSWF